MCNGAAKQVSEGFAPCNMVDFVKLFEPLCETSFPKWCYTLKLLLLSPLRSLQPLQNRKAVLLFVKLDTEIFVQCVKKVSGADS